MCKHEGGRGIGHLRQSKPAKNPAPTAIPSEHSLTLECDGQTVPGLLWTPGASGPYPLIVAGHGFTMHKRALYPATLVADLVARGYAVAAIDAPGHGDRRVEGGLSSSAADRAWRDHWRAHGAERIAAEYTAVIDDLFSRPDIAPVVGYWGLSLATQYGVGVLAREPRIRAAVLGLSALPEPGPRTAAYAEGLTCPVFFIQQLDDKIAPLDRSTALFDRLGSADKTLRVSPGGHMEVPEAVFAEAYDFLEKWLRA